MLTSINPTLIGTFLLATLCVGGVLYAVLQPQLARSAAAKRRMAMVLNGNESSTALKGATDGKMRRRSVEDTLKEIEEKQKVRAKSESRRSLESQLREAGIGWSKTAFWGLCIGLGSVALFIFWAGFGFSLPTSGVLALLSGVLLPKAYISLRRRRRLAAFAALFPDAVDVIVRGVKSGMPLGDCIRVVAFEAQEPLRSEFKAVVDEQTLGVPAHEAVMRLAERVTLPETNFLAIVIMIQSRSGGNLSEALGNLSTVLRERKKMRGKIKAMSAEAKASGGIIGSLPPIVASLLYLTSPEYISLLFTTTIGNVVLVGCAIWMSIGILIMHKMINFDF